MRQRRQRTNFNDETIEALDVYFAKNPYPDINERESIAKELKTNEDRIQVWFQNKRARYRKKMNKPQSVATTKKAKVDVPKTGNPSTPSTTCHSTPSPNKSKTSQQFNDSAYVSYNQSLLDTSRSSLQNFNLNSMPFYNYSSPYYYNTSYNTPFNQSYLGSSLNCSLSSPIQYTYDCHKFEKERVAGKPFFRPFEWNFFLFFSIYIYMYFLI